MPNYVRNVIKMDGIANLPLFSEENGERFFDFNKIIPMPNDLNVVDGGDMDKEIIFFITDGCSKSLKAVSKIGMNNVNKMFRDRFFATPQNCYDRAKEKTSKMTIEEKNDFYNKGKKYYENILKYGFPTWYEWRCNHWGTKWNSDSLEIVDDNEIRFDTAWNYPKGIMKKLSSMYPEKEIITYWADEDCGNNTGSMIYDGTNGYVYGGYFEDGSSDAYEIYYCCWGDSDCLDVDDDGNWYHKDCGECGMCY